MIVEVIPQYDLVAYSSGTPRGLFGDILSPIKGLLSDAFHAFEPPVMFIVKNVVTKVLNVLIKFIADAVMEIFPNFDAVEGIAVNLIEEFINIVPNFAEAIDAILHTAILAVDEVGSTIRDSTAVFCTIITTAFTDLKKINQKIGRKMAGVVGELGKILDAGAQDAVITVESGQSALVTVVTDAVSSVQSLVETIPTLIATGVRTGFAEITTILSDACKDILKTITSVILACDNIVTQVISTFTQELDKGLKFFENDINEACVDVSRAVGFMCDRIVKIPDDIAEGIGKSLRAAVYATGVTEKIIDDAVGTVDTGVRSITSSVSSTSGDPVNFNSHIASSAKAIGFGMVTGSLIIGLW